MAPTSKRTKAAKATEESEPPKRSARARKGKLEELPNMPLDILYEVRREAHYLYRTTTRRV